MTMGNLLAMPLAPTRRGSAKVPSEGRKRRPPSRICKHEGCEQYVVDQGLCVRHGVRVVVLPPSFQLDEPWLNQIDGVLSTWSRAASDARRRAAPVGPSIRGSAGGTVRPDPTARLAQGGTQLLTGGAR